MWSQCLLDAEKPFTETLAIIDDALCYYFEFKVENHQLYFRIKETD